MKVLLVDGNWNLKRNYEKRQTMFAKGEHAGGAFGFLDSMRSVINKVMPDRTVVLWDGILGGTLRKDFYPHYKENRNNKSWDKESYEMDDIAIAEEEKRKHSILQQRIKVKN